MKSDEDVREECDDLRIKVRVEVGNDGGEGGEGIDGLLSELIRERELVVGFRGGTWDER